MSQNGYITHFMYPIICIIYYISHIMYYIRYIIYYALYIIFYILYNLYRILFIFEGIPHQWSIYGNPPPRVFFPHPNCSSHQESMCVVPPSSAHFFSMVSPPLLLNHKSSPTCISKWGTPSWAFLSDVYGRPTLSPLDDPYM